MVVLTVDRTKPSVTYSGDITILPGVNNINFKDKAALDAFKATQWYKGNIQTGAIKEISVIEKEGTVPDVSKKAQESIEKYQAKPEPKK